MLVSIDGFRWDYLDRPEARQMKALADLGVRVTKLLPVYPSKTCFSLRFWDWTGFKIYTVDIIIPFFDIGNYCFYLI